MVQVNCFISEPILVTTGVIQGIVVCPLLFLLFVNDVFNGIRKGLHFSFADGITNFCTLRSEAFESAIISIPQDSPSHFPSVRLDDEILCRKR